MLFRPVAAVVPVVIAEANVTLPATPPQAPLVPKADAPPVPRPSSSLPAT
jgi:hypothetical protein